MKSLSIFLAIVGVHVVIIAALLVQPGCQSQTPPPGAQATQVAPQSGLGSPQRPATGSGAGQLDPAFNAGISGSGAATTATAGPGGRQLSTPTRPVVEPRSEPDRSGLQPVLQPVREVIPAAVEGREITVRSGDTPIGIARREGVSLEALLEANGLNRNSSIFVGQTLRIPQARTEQPPSQEQQPEATGSSITVARGDTLSGLASRHGTTVAALKSLNGLRSDTIVVGQELRLPAASAASAPERQQATASSGQGSSYTVRAGDTPSGIARRFGISAQQLMAANGITDARRLFVGQDLIIPGNAAARTDRGRQPSARAAEPASEPVVRPRPQTTAPQRELSAPTREPVRQEPPREEAPVDPMSALEALEEEDLPFVEVETIDNGEE